MSNPCLNISQLEYQFVGPLDFVVNSAQIIGLSGESGCGKSLMLRAIADMDEHKGDISLYGMLANEMTAPEWRHKVALLPADSQWWFDTVGEHFHRLDKNLLTSLGFDESALDWSIGRISTGEKQRLALLRLLENKPSVLLLDEPTANLDKKNTLVFESVVKNYLHENNACAIWVSHNMDQLDRVAESIFKLESGQLMSHTC